MVFNFSPPPRFGKLFIVLVSSIIGLDETLVLDGNLPAHSSSFVEGPKGRNRTPKNKKSATEEHLMIMKQMMPPHENIIQNMHDTSRTPFHKQQHGKVKRDDARPQQVGDSSEKPKLTPLSPCWSTSQGVIYTRNKSAEGSAQVPNPNQPKPFGRQAARQKEQYKWNSTPNDSSKAVSHEGVEETRHLLFSQRARHIVHETHEPAPLRFSEREDMHSPTTLLRQDNQAPRYMHNEHESRGIRKREQALGAWQTDRKKQQRTQQRAFASKSDNPFSSFQHDPNDAESFLDALSQVDHHPIIPPGELRMVDEIVHARGGLHEPSRFFGSTRRRRQASGTGHILSNHDMLRMKAEEANAYSIAFTPPNIQSPYYDVPARLTPPRHCHENHADHAYLLAQGEQMSIYSDKATSPYQGRGTGPRQCYGIQGAKQYDEIPYMRHRDEIYPDFGAARIDIDPKAYHGEQQVGGGWSGTTAVRARHVDIPSASQFTYTGRIPIEYPDGIESWAELHMTEDSNCDFSFPVENSKIYP
jgi:hypothetical protein